MIRFSPRMALAALGLLGVVWVVLQSMGTFDAADPQEQIGVQWIKTSGSAAAYVGNEACRECHHREFQLHMQTPHARTVQLIPAQAERPEFASRQTVLDAMNNVTYAVRKTGGKNIIAASRGAQSKSDTARWVFGSGTHAHTYLSQNDDEFRQLRITYYPPSKIWAFTPGSKPGASFENALGDDYNAGQAVACFGCHSTALVGSRQHLDLEHSLLNVGCESCHGPGREHIESVKAANAASSGSVPTGFVKPPTHSGAEIMQLCGTCHRVPVAVDENQALPESQLPRFPGIALVRSRCFTESAGKLSCITCHKPHESTAKQGENEFVRACLGCHTAPQGKGCSLRKTSGCVNCHMPEESIARQLPLHFHNHWIRRQPPKPAAESSALNQAMLRLNGAQFG